MKRICALLLALVMMVSVCSLTVGAEEPQPTYTATFEGLTGAEATQVTTGVVTRPVAEPTKEGYQFVGWTTYPSDNFVYITNFEQTQMNTIYSDETFSPVWVPVGVSLHDITCYVMNADGEPVSNAWVAVTGNGGTYGNTATDEAGKFTVRHLPDGVWNVQITDPAAGSMMLYLLTTPEDNGTTYTLPKDRAVVMTLKFGELTEYTVFDGLDQLVKDEAEAGSTVSYSVTATAGYDDSDDAEQQQIRDLAGNQKLAFFNFNISKTVEQEVELSKTQHPITLIMPYDTTRKNVQVYRMGDHGAEAFIQTSSRADASVDGTCYQDAATGLLYICTSRTGQFAIGRDYGAIHNIMTEDSEEGMVFIFCETQEVGEVVQVTADSFYDTAKLDTIIVTDAAGNVLPLYEEEPYDGYFFTMPDSDVTVRAVFKEYDPMMDYFTDVPKDAYYYDSVLWAARYGVTSGVDATHFGPNGTLSRAMVVTMLWRLFDCPEVECELTFPDVPADTWYTEAVRWAQSTGIVTGFADGTFKPMQNITREQLAVILYHAAEMEGHGFRGASMFYFNPVDRASISSWASESMRWCYMKQILRGDTSGALRPQDTASRAEAVCMIQRFFDTMWSEEIVGDWDEMYRDANADEIVCFAKAVADTDYEDYTLVYVLGTQVVSGINYRFLCAAPDGTEKVITVYCDLEQNCTVTSVDELD